MSQIKFGDSEQFLAVRNCSLSPNLICALLLGAPEECGDFQVGRGYGGGFSAAVPSRYAGCVSTTVESGGNHGNLHFVLHGLVQHGAENDVRLSIGRIMNDVRRFADLVRQQIRTAGTLDANAAGV